MFKIDNELVRKIANRLFNLREVSFAGLDKEIRYYCSCSGCDGGCQGCAGCSGPSNWGE